VRRRQSVEDLTSPLPSRGAPGDDGGPSTAVGMAPVGAEDWHAARTGTHRGGTAIDGGPPLPAAPRVAGDGPAGLGGATDLRERDDFDDYDEYDGPRTARRPRRRDAAARDRRLGRSAREAAPAAWSAVLVQWLAGALGGAVLWVLFRFLWRALPVVAVAAAIVVVVGLVLVVRTLLHNDDKRTTVFAVLVGCCSPRPPPSWCCSGDDPHAMTPPVALSTASVYPEPLPAAFEIAAELGYDGVELMVWNDPPSQDPAASTGSSSATACRCWPCTPPASPSPSASGTPTRSSASAAPSTPPPGSARAPWCSTRRSAGSAATPRSSPTRWPAPASATAWRWPWRTCSR
jgi:uncharacterized MAPEG superfamily protein